MLGYIQRTNYLNTKFHILRRCISVHNIKRCAYDSVRREALYNILIGFGIHKKLVRLIKMCLTETYSRVRVGKNLSEMFPIKNGLKQADAL